MKRFPNTILVTPDQGLLAHWKKALGTSRQTVAPQIEDFFQLAPSSPSVVWIDLSKDHYGIHGTPEPQNIGRTQSHGCIRLTNWDAARLAQMVQSGMKAVFQP